MKGLKKKFRRGLAGFLSFVLTMTSFNMVSWADVASAFEKENATFVMSGEDLRDSAQAAIDNGDEFNFEDLGVDTSDRSLAKEYQRLFETGSVFEFAPAYDMDEEEYADGAELRMFIRINGDPEGYQITGDEDIIFLYINDSSARVTFRSRIDGYTTQKVTVKGNSTLLEAAGPTVPSDGAGAAGGAGAGTNGAAGGEVQNSDENAGGENGTVEGNVQNPESDAADGSVQNPDANAGEGNGTTDGTVENPDAGVNDGTDNGTTGSDIQNPAGNADEGNGTAGETTGNPEINGNNGSGTAGSDIQNPDANVDSDKNANTGKDEQIQNPADHSGSSDNGQNSENGKTEEGQKSEAGADKQSSNDDKGGSNASSDEGNAGSGASDSGSSDSGSSDSGASSSGDAVVSAASVIRNYTHILTTSVNNEAGSDEKASSDERNEEKEVVSADSGDSKEKADAGEKKDAEEVKADTEDSNSSDSDNKEAAAAPADDVESNTVDDGDKADAVIPADGEEQNSSDDQADGQGEITAPADNQDNAVIDDNVKDDADKNAAADSKADDTNAAGNDHGVNADGGKNDNTLAVEPEDEEEKEEVSKTGTTSGKTYGQIVLDESYYAKAYVTTLNKLHVDVSKEGYAVTYTVTPVGTAAVKGAKNVEAGKDLTFTVKPQVGYVIDSVTANGESLEAVEEDDATDSNAETGVKWFVVPEVEEEQEIVVTMAETGKHPEFNFSKTLGDVVVSLHAEEGILPAGTVAKVTEVTEKVEEAVKEKKEHEENTEVSAVLAYDIKLFHDGEELDNSWSDNGYVEVTFSGTDIEKKSAVADSVEVLHVDTGEVDTTDADIDKIAVEEVQSLETVAETVNVEGNDAVGEISFEAEHFSVYTLTFIKNKTEYELIVNSRAFSGYRPVENFNYENKVSVDANRDIIPVAELAEETITVDNKNYHFSKATAENNYESANVNGITCDSAGVLSGVGTDGKKIELADNNIYIWYVPVGEEIPVVFYYMDKSGHVRSQHDGIIPAGMIAENAPEVDGYRFKEAKVSGIGAGTVNYITKDGDTVYYSDDTIGSDVSYALVDNQKIELYYIEKFEEFKITYLVSGDDKNSKNEYDGPTIVEKGENLIFQVKVAAGYDVSISIGNKIINPETTALSDRVRTYRYGPINSDTTVNIKYSKINQFLFDTEYIRTHNNAASGYFHNATYSPHSNEKAGSYSGKKTYIQNNGNLIFTMTTASDIYWQMNGFQVNDVDIAVPAEYKVGAKSSQTLYDEAGNAIVNININLVSINGRSYSYTVTFSNVLTDITITGGNFRAKDHSEVMPIDISEGVIAEYRYKVAGKYPWNPAEWTAWPGTAVKGSSPIGFEGTDDVIGFRYKAKPGYTEPTVVVDKGTVSKITSSGEYKEFAITKTYESLPATLSITNQPIIYTVKYHENGGISGTAPTDSSRYSIEDNHSIYVSTKIPGNEDSQQVFQGWALTADATEPIVGTNQEIELADILSKAPKTGNEINLYAVWTINPAAKYANYKIEIYREGDNGYSHFVTEYGRGLADTSLRLKTSNYENKYEEDGYYLNLSAPDTKVTIEKLSRENDSNQNVFRLYYDLKRYTITTRVENGSILYNGGDVSNSQVSAKYGMDAAFDYSGLDDYKLVKIEIDGKVLSAEEMKANTDSYTFYNVRKNHSITVKYEQWYQVTYDKGMAEGTVPVDSKKYEKGAEVTVLPNIGLTLETESELTTSFIAWTPDLDSEVKTLYYPGDHFEIVKDTVLYPVFAGGGSEYRTITFAAGDNGSLEKAGTTSSSFAYPIGAGDVFEKVITGESFIPVPSPNTDYKFSKWSVEGENIQYASAKELFEAYAESPVDDDLVFTAEFVSMKDAGYEFWFNGVGLGDALDNLGTYVKSSSQWIINTAWNAAGFDGDSLPLNTIKEVEERANEVRNLYVQETGKTNLVYKYFTVDQENDSGSWDSIFDSTQNTDNDFKTLKLRSNHMTRYHIVFEASMEVTATAQELTYDGTAQNLLKNVAVTVKETGEVIEEPELTFRVAKYADGVLGDYERLDTPTGVDAGKYSVEIRASKEGYTDVKTWVDVTIKKRILKFKTLYKEKDYDGKPLTNPVFEITEGDAAPNQELQVYVNGSITNVGKIKNTVSSHRVVASGTDVSDKNAKDYKDNYEISYFEEDLVVNAAKGNRVTVEGQTVEYDGKAYGLISASAEKEGSTLLYSTNGTEYSETAPTFTEAGTHTVYVKATNPNYKETEAVSAAVVIRPRNVTITVNSASKTYGTKDPEFTGNYDDLVSSGAVVKEGDLGKVSYVRAAGDENKNNVGDEIGLTAEYTKNPNYRVGIVPGTLTITEAEGNRVSAEGREVTYDGNAYGLISASAEKEGSTLLYSTNGTEYSETAPTFTEAGTHTVYVKATNPNYKETKAVSAAVVIRPRNVTITVNSASKTYGTKDPEFTGNYDDLVSSGAVVKEGDLGKVSYVRAAGDENKNNVGDEIRLTAEYTKNPNYTVEIVPGMLTIVAAGDNGVSAEGQTVTYDGTGHGLKRAEALKEGSTLWYSTDNKEFSETAPLFTEAGSYTVYVKAKNPNYADTDTAEATVEIKKRGLEFKTLKKEKDYDGTPLTNPAFEVTKGDTAPGQELQVYVSGSITEAGRTANTVSSYRVVAAGTDAADKKAKDYKSNYEVHYTEEELIVNLAAGNRVTAEGQTVEYDGKAYGLISASAEKEGSTLLYSTNGTEYSETAPTFTEAGTHTVYVKATNPNYKETEAVSAAVVIRPRNVTITVNSASKTYGTKDPEFTGNYDDLVSSGAVVKEGDLGKVSYVRAAGDENKNNVGDEISLTAEYTKNPNYRVGIVLGTLTITEAEGNRVSAEGREVTYDGNAYGLISASAEKEGSTLLYSTNGTEYSETAPTFTEAGTHTVYVKATNPNYKETEAVSAAVVIRPRNVTITVNSASKTYGTKDPEFTGNYDDLVSSGAVVKEGDLGKVSYVRAAGDENKNNVGDEIRLTAEYTKNPNYRVEILPGTLTITEAEGNRVSAEGREVTYDGNTYGLTSASAEKEGSTLLYSTNGTEYSETAPIFTEAGTHTVYVKATNPNYKETEAVSAAVVIRPRNVTITVNSASKTYGTKDPEFTGNYDDLVSSGAVVKEGDLGKVSYVRAAGDENKNNVGDEISLTAEYTKNPNYRVDIVPGTLTITEAEGNRVSAEGREVTYDGNAYGLIGASAEKEGSTLLYSTNGTEYSETAPTFTEAGTHTVYVKATNPNYKETEAVSAAVVIRPRNVTITVNSVSKTYGDPDPEFTGNYKDLVSSGAVVKEGDLGKVSYARAAGDENKNNVGDEIRLTAEYTKNPNYTVEIVPGMLTIVAAGDNGVSAEGQTVTYDGTGHGLKRAEALKEGSTLWYSTDNKEFSETAPLFTEAGSYTVYVKAKNPNYADTDTAEATVEIKKRGLEFKTLKKEKDYDGTPLTNPAFEVTKGDTAPGQELQVYVSGSITEAGRTANTVSSYRVVAAGTDAADEKAKDYKSNYEVHYTEEELIVNLAAGNRVTAEGQTVEYDGKAYGLISASAEKEGSTLLYSTNGTEYSETAPTFTEAGTHTVYVKATNPNYKETEAVSAAVVIRPRNVTITVNSASKTYGTKDPEFTGNYDDLVSSGAVVKEGDLGKVSYVRAAGDENKNNVGDEISLTAEYTKNPNYRVEIIPGMLTIVAAGDNEVSAEGQTVTYDGTGHGLKRAEALKEGSTLWYSTDNKEFSETAPSFTDAGSYTVYVKATNPNYKETPVVNATIVINKKEAVIIVDNVTKVYGYEDPLFTGSISELIGSDDLGTVAFVRQSGDERKNNVGDKVRLTANYTENSNYHVVVYEGHLTIVAATDNGVNVEGQALVYDGLNHGLKNAIALKEGSKLLYSTNKIEFSETAPTFTEAGTYTVYVKATNPNYNETQVAEGTVVISKREITITADSAEKRYDGTDLTAPTATITGGTLAEGQTLESVTVTGAQRSTGTSANVASNAMIKSGNTDVTANYAITYTDGVLTVTSVGGNSGGNPGGNGGGSTPNENKPYQPGGPGDNNGPTVTIDPDAVPLANAPVDGSPTDNLILIDDGNVPLAGLPKTGDRAGAQAGLAAILSGFLLAAFSMLNNKKKEENK